MTGLQSVPVYKLPLMLSAPRKFSWENAFIDFSMADHDTQAAAEAEAKEAAMAAAAESASGESYTSGFFVSVLVGPYPLWLSSVLLASVSAPCILHQVLVHAKRCR